MTSFVWWARRRACLETASAFEEADDVEEAGAEPGRLRRAALGRDDAAGQPARLRGAALGSDEAVGPHALHAGGHKAVHRHVTATQTQKLHRNWHAQLYCSNEG